MCKHRTGRQLCMVLALSAWHSSRMKLASASGFLPKDYAYELGGPDAQQILAKYHALQHMHLWQTLDGSRPYLDHLKNLKQDHWTPQQHQTDSYDGPDAVSASAPVHGSPKPCGGTLGTWCRDWWLSQPVPARPAPRGDKECQNNCNNVGVCNHDIGICQCPPGWQGDDCGTRQTRPCTNRFSGPEDPPGVPVGHLDENNHDKDLLAHGWTASRCAGYCDDRLGACYCGYNSTYGHIPAPKGSPPGTPPVQQGRPMHDGCKPTSNDQGKATTWGVVPWENLYGPHGWCQAEPHKLQSFCGCNVESMDGPGCSAKKLTFCPNQCNGRGECDLGFCKCDPGWYGTSCDKKKAGAPIEPMNVARLGPEARLVWRAPFDSSKARAQPTRKRPLIYVYDLPSDYNAKILGYRLQPNTCVWRNFAWHGGLAQHDGGYLVEILFHDALLSSIHRTLDPEEADFFYLPIYLTCYTWPVLGWADGPWYYAPTVHPRPMHSMHMVLEAKRWVQQHYPYWNRTNGRDHILMVNHDEGPCYMPTEVYNTAIVLHHWGRTDPDHVSGSAWPADNYSWPLNDFPKHQPYDWRELYQGHPCYTPGKDLVIPNMKKIPAIQWSPLLGQPPLKRDILLFFRADTGQWREWWYSRGIRQSLYRLAHEDHWREKYQIVIGSRENYPGDYSKYLARSKFCLVVMGDGHSPRSEDAILHGCIPVLINDNVQPVYDTLIDWTNIGIRIPQSRLQEVPQILQAVPEAKVLAMQRTIAKIWSRFLYTSHPLLKHDLIESYAKKQPILNATRLRPRHPYHPLKRFPKKQDAFHTIMQWLHSRMPYAKGNATLDELK